MVLITFYFLITYQHKKSPDSSEKKCYAISPDARIGR